MKSKRTLTRLPLVCVAACLLSVMTATAAPPATAESISADTILKQMSEKLAAARTFGFKATRAIEPDLAGGDGLHGKASVKLLVQRPDKAATTATIPGDTRRCYFDGTQFTLVDEKKKVYSTVPMAVSLDELPSKLARIYGFTPPLAEFLVSDLYQDLTWRAQAVEHRGMGIIKTGLFGLKGVRCHRLGLTGKSADSELWVAVKDKLPRRWISKLKGNDGEVTITIDLSKWNLEAKTRAQDFVFSPDEDDLEVPMVTEVEMNAVSKAATQNAGGKQ